MLLVCGGIFVEEIVGRPPRLGGSGLTAALAAARYGADVCLAGWLGAGEAEEAFALLDGAGVDRLGVQVLDGTTTTYRISDLADLSRPAPGITQGDVPSGPLPALPSCPIVLCFGTPGFDVVRARWLDRAADGATLLFDRQGSHSTIASAAMAATIPAARKILLANVFEAFSETKKSSLSDAVKRLPPEDYAAAVIKAGPWGVLTIDAEGGHQSFGAHDVPVLSAIGSGDVFAGVLAAHISAGDSFAVATSAASAAAAAWISSDEDHPGEDLPTRADAIAAGPAVWVDRRDLEELRFSLETDPRLEPRVRERIGRALRYLGMETAHTPKDTVRAIDLRAAGDVGTDPVATAVTGAIRWVRATCGSPRP
jgi:hypothetical protein